MPEMHDFDWFLSRLEVARQDSERDVFTNCPVHGGSDSLHVTEKNGKALVRCMAQQCRYQDIVAALEGHEIELEDDTDESEDGLPTIVRVRHGRRTERQVIEPSEQVGDPLDWAAEYCGVDRAFIDTLPMVAVNHEVGFCFGDKPLKFRAAGGKKFRWAKGLNPPLWPVPTECEAEIMLVEGEFDAVVMRSQGFDAYSLTKGAETPMGSQVWGALFELGVRTVVLMLDTDDAGKKGTERLAAEARESGLEVILARVRGVQPLLGEKDARDVASRGGVPEPEEVALEVFESGASLISQIPDRIPWLGMEHAFYRGGTTIVAGPPKVGKTTIVYWVAQNVTLLGGKVAILTEETGPALKLKVGTYGLQKASILTSWAARARGLTLEESIAAVVREDADLVIVDTFADWSGVDDENDATGVTRAMQTIRMAATDNTAVVVIHHTRKGGGEAGAAIRGSTAFAGSADTLVEVSEAGDELRKLDIRGRVTNPTVLYFERRPDGSFEETSGPEDLDGDIINVVAQNPSSMGEIWKALGNQGRPTSAFRSSVERLVHNGKLGIVAGVSRNGGPVYELVKSNVPAIKRVSRADKLKPKAPPSPAAMPHYAKED